MLTSFRDRDVKNPKPFPVIPNLSGCGKIIWTKTQFKNRELKRLWIRIGSDTFSQSMTYGDMS